MDSVEAHERLATLETNMQHALQDLHIVKADVEALKGVIWKAAGAATVIVLILQLLMRLH